MFKISICANSKTGNFGYIFSLKNQMLGKIRAEFYLIILSIKNYHKLQNCQILLTTSKYDISLNLSQRKI
ncbi:hypothetical protein BpHYR1_042283 [Brachionus plicatilis]|uniref:Uncharacterized protein n=1 Tax=Brachionus plicatilis TaxID=10195 RepID=A0A3M7R5F2_BRAPC|nr:hypothetical protein BpHYR1_042283 [Brachionus plicatilis]